MGLTRHDADLKVAEEAAYWLHRLRAEDTPQTHAQFSAWVKKSTLNLQEFLFAQAVWKELDHVDPAMREKLWSVGDEEPVIPLLEGRGRAASVLQSRSEPLRRRRFVWTLTAAASLAVLALASVLFVDLPLRRGVYATDIGDQKAVKLEDGSVVHLNTRSRAEVRYTERERVVTLLEGEALVVVEHDGSRPFYVLTEAARIRALGTQFNVYRGSAAETRVAVVQGLVQVSARTDPADEMDAGRGAPPTSPAAEPTGSSIQLAAGDEAAVAAGEIVKAPVPDVERAVAWRARRLVFPGDPVGEIVTEFNRYNRTQIRIEDDELRSRRMSGVFDADDPSPLIEYLARDPEVVVQRAGNEIVIRPR